MVADANALGRPRRSVLALGRVATCEPNTQHHNGIMDLIWNIISVFGLVSLLILVVGIWTHLDMRKKQRQDESEIAKPEKKP